jgi:hypothetical protein
MFLALFGVTEGLFAFGGFDGHAFTLGCGERMLLDTGQREGITPIMERRGHRTDEPVFEDPHAPDAALIKVGPMLHQGLTFHVERDLLQEGEQHRLEVTAVLLLLKLVTREMDVQAAPGGLPT